MQEFVQIEGLSMENIAFIGDELNDVKLLRACGLGIAVGDADKRAKNSSIVICEGLGGRGAFREAVEILLDLRGFDFEKIINNNL